MQITLPKYFQTFVDSTVEAAFDLIVTFEYTRASPSRYDEQGSGASAQIDNAVIKYLNSDGVRNIFYVMPILSAEQISDIEEAILRQLEKEECSPCLA
ncbi:MAG: hypothetical protein ACYC0M_15440 [Burkholderiales bacterium]